MSLISDALKKARQEAARQDALRQRTPYAVGVADSADRRTSLLPLLAGLGAGCLVAGIVLAFAWSAGWGPFARSAKQPVRVADAAPPANRVPAPPVPSVAVAPPPAAVPSQAMTPTPPPAAAPIEEPRPQPSIEVRPSPPPVPAPAAPVEEQRPTPPPPVAATPPPPAPPPGATDLVDGQTYAGEVPVPGGGTVKLNGIAYSQEHPIAVLDGRVMAPGEMIQGFTLVAIETGRVKLQGYGATVFLSSR